LRLRNRSQRRRIARSISARTICSTTPGRLSSSQDLSIGRSVSRTKSSSGDSCFFTLSVNVWNAELTAAIASSGSSGSGSGVGSVPSPEVRGLAGANVTSPGSSSKSSAMVCVLYPWRVPLFKGAVKLYPWDKIDSPDPRRHFLCARRLRQTVCLTRLKNAGTNEHRSRL